MRYRIRVKLSSPVLSEIHKNAFVFSGLAGLGNMDNEPSKIVHYELIDHTADFGVRIFGKDAADLFRNGALALTDLITDRPNAKSGRTCYIRVAGNDWEDLMVNWLREVLYLWSGKEMLLQDVTIESICENEMEVARIARLIDLERSMEGMSKRTGIFNKIDNIFSEEWRTEEDLLIEIDEKVNKDNDYQ